MGAVSLMGETSLHYYYILHFVYIIHIPNMFIAVFTNTLAAIDIEGDDQGFSGG